MLKKLLKYDFKSIFKFWWIGAVTTFALSLLSAGSITVLKNPRDLPEIVNASAIFIIVISVLSLAVFAVLTTVLIFVRFYRNFFTYEGYLTFTLPVSVGKLLNSKLIVAVVASVATLIMIFLDVFAMLGIGFAKEIFSKELWEPIFTYIRECIEEIGFEFIAYTVLYFVEGIALLILAVLFSYLFLYSCITLAAVITKKARVITAIGIYYGVNVATSFILQLLMIFGFPRILDLMSNLADELILPTIALVLFGGIAFVGVICVMLYTLQHWMLDRKLNLS